MEKVVFEGVRHFRGCAPKVEYFSKIPFPRARLRFLAHLKSISQRPFSLTMFLSTDECQLKYFFLLFSTISHEPSKTQDRTIWQMKHLNLTNMKVFCHFCLKLSEIAQIRHGRRANIYGPPCTKISYEIQYQSKKAFLMGDILLPNGPKLVSIIAKEELHFLI